MTDSIGLTLPPPFNASTRLGCRELLLRSLSPFLFGAIIVLAGCGVPAERLSVPANESADQSAASDPIAVRYHDGEPAGTGEPSELASNEFAQKNETTAQPSANREAGRNERKLNATSPQESQRDEPPIAARNVVELRKRVGKSVRVEGRIARTAKSTGSGHQFLNFDNSELTAVCFGEDVKRFDDGEPADIFRDKSVVLSGKLELYRGKLQIKLERPDQIRIADEDGDSPDGTTSAAKIELKAIGKDAWLSPAGLRYAGRDPDGLTRLEHVRRHMRDQPDRDGPHGVFDGEEGVALAVIDEAWRTIKDRRIKPQVERGREAYTVSLGRRIGFLGGSLGAERRHPPLSRVFIVVEEGTSNVVTAFPK